MTKDEEKLENSKGLIKFLLRQSKEYLEQAKFHCDMIYPHWHAIEEKIAETRESIEKILEALEERH
jgi:hypothetical protein